MEPVDVDKICLRKALQVPELKVASMDSVAQQFAKALIEMEIAMLKDGLILMEYDRLKPVPLRRNLWIRLFLLTGIDSRWQRNAWMKICEKTQADLDRDNSIWLWEKTVLKNL